MLKYIAQQYYCTCTLFTLTTEPAIISCKMREVGRVPTLKSFNQIIEHPVVFVMNGRERIHAVPLSHQGANPLEGNNVCKASIS